MAAAGTVPAVLQGVANAKGADGARLSGRRVAIDKPSAMYLVLALHQHSNACAKLSEISIRTLCITTT